MFIGSTDPEELFGKSEIVATIPANSPFAPSYTHSFGKFRVMLLAYKSTFSYIYINICVGCALPRQAIGIWPCYY